MTTMKEERADDRYTCPDCGADNAWSEHCPCEMWCADHDNACLHDNAKPRRCHCGAVVCDNCELGKLHCPKCNANQDALRIVEIVERHYTVRGVQDDGAIVGDGTSGELEPIDKREDPVAERLRCIECNAEWTPSADIVWDC